MNLMPTITHDTSKSKTRSARTEKERQNLIAYWLFFMCALVALMVVVGGATRLTDSGLSITEWKPITGAVPPLSHEAWLSEFEKYKQIPEYEIVNQGMSLADFKVIYWWEWGHRFLGRLIGVAFVVPLIIFAVNGWVERRLGIKLFGLLILGGAQGALGWYMVQSGLSDRVDVSQYRLAAHLGLAVILFAALYWTALDLSHKEHSDRRLNKLGVGALYLSLGVFGQIILGAFVAGLRAGKTYTTWPLMDGQFFPDAYFSATPALADMFETIAAVQFNHRIGAYILAALGVWYFFAAGKVTGSDAQQSKFRGQLVLGAIGVQIILGISTLILATPLSLGLLHQLGALGVLCATLYAAHGSRISNEIAAGSSSD